LKVVLPAETEKGARARRSRERGSRRVTEALLILSAGENDWKIMYWGYNNSFKSGRAASSKRQKTVAAAMAPSYKPALPTDLDRSDRSPSLLPWSLPVVHSSWEREWSADSIILSLECHVQNI